MLRLARASSTRALAICSVLLFANASAISASSVGSPKCLHQSCSTCALGLATSGKSWLRGGSLEAVKRLQKGCTSIPDACWPTGVVQDAKRKTPSRADAMEVLVLRMVLNSTCWDETLFQRAHQNV